MPDRLTTPEGVDKLTDDIAAKLAKLRMSTDKQANGHGGGPVKSWYDRYGSTINVVLGVLLTTSIALVGGVYKSSMDRLDAIEATSNKAVNGVERIDKDRLTRIADLDRWREGVENELRVYRIGHSEFQVMKGTVSELGKKLSDGRDERLRDRETDRAANQANRDMIMGAIGDLKTQVALLRQSMGGARGRRPDDFPFDGNQRWIAPLWNPPFPSILKAIYFQNRAAPILRAASR